MNLGAKTLFMLILVIILSLLLLSGCTGVSKEAAEKRASDFVKGRVKFFSKQNNASVVLDYYNFKSITSENVRGSWVVRISVSAAVDNETREKDIMVVVDRDGNVIQLDGQKIIYKQ